MDEGQQAPEERRKGAVWVFAAGLGVLGALAAVSVVSMRGKAPVPGQSASVAQPASDTAGVAGAAAVGSVDGTASVVTGDNSPDNANDTDAGDEGTEVVAKAEPAKPAAAATPTFDVVRLDPEGNAVVAGVATPGAEVQVLIDGAEAARATAGADGKFVALFSVPPDASARMVTLGMNGQGGTQIASAQSVMLAPAPKAVPDVAMVEADPGLQAEPSAADPTDTGEAVLATSDPEEQEQAAATAVVMLGQTPEETEVLQSGASPAVQDHVSIDAIAYDDSGDVLIAGRGRAESAVRVYVDNKPLTTTPVTAEGSWRLVLPEVDSGLYTLRVDALDSEGKVTSRFETPFQREERAVAAQAVAETAAPDPARAVASRVTVQPGFTLWGIARANYGEGMMYVQLYQANKDLIRDPDLIYPGQIFAVPGN
ncbi:MAG: LysM peptidoglycan-binding domain-containing protein [Paracoccaceae bacterium]